MPGIIMHILEMMEEKQIKEKLITYLNNNKELLIKRFNNLMIVMAGVIAIVLVIGLIDGNKKYKESLVKKNYDKEDISFNICENQDVEKFIKSYFKSRTDLNFPMIFSFFGRDYYKEEYDAPEKVKEIEKNIRYERTFVKSYDNIKIYISKGMNEKDIVALVTYDMILGFANDSAPMILMFYLEPNGTTYTIKKDIDIGTSKFLIECSNNEYVQQIYNDVKLKLTRNLNASEILRLVYNSLRQYEMNIDGAVNYENKKFTDSLNIEKSDFIKDFDKVYQKVKKEKEELKNKEKLETYLESIKASVSDIVRRYEIK